MKITDSKGLVVRVGGTIHVDGATTPPPTGPPALPVADAWYPVAPWEAGKAYPAGAVVEVSGEYWTVTDYEPPGTTAPTDANSGNWGRLSGASLASPAAQNYNVSQAAFSKGVSSWEPKVYAAGKFVVRTRKVWRATATTAATDEPGVSGLWERIPGIDEVASRVDNVIGAPSTTWDPTGVYPQGSVVQHAGATWLAKDPALAGDEPTPTSVVWKSLTLEALDARIASSGGGGGASKPPVLLAKVLYSQLTPSTPMMFDQCDLKMDTLGLKMLDPATFPAAHLKERFVHPDLVDDSGNTGGLQIVDFKTKYGDGDLLVDWSFLTRPKTADPTAFVEFYFDAASSSWAEPFGYRWFQQRIPYSMATAASGRVMIEGSKWDEPAVGFESHVRTTLPNGAALYEAGVVAVTFRLMFVPA